MKRTWIDATGVDLLTDKTMDAHTAALRLVRRGAVSGGQRQCMHAQQDKWNDRSALRQGESLRL